jgi:hypothetical protein
VSLLALKEQGTSGRKARPPARGHGDGALPLGSQRRGYRHNIVAPLVCHDDAPNIAAPALQGSRYTYRLPPSGGVIGQDVASFVCDPLAAEAGFKMEKIPRHGVGHLSANSQRYLSNATDTDRTGCRRAQIDDPSTDERPAVIDAHHYGASGVPVGNGDSCSKR